MSDIAPGEEQEERESYGDVVLVERLRAALERINPRAPVDAREDALRQVDATDRQIDNLVYELYGLTEEEIAIVEGD